MAGYPCAWACGASVCNLCGAFIAADTQDYGVPAKATATPIALSDIARYSGHDIIDAITAQDSKYAACSDATTEYMKVVDVVRFVAESAGDAAGTPREGQK